MALAPAFAFATVATPAVVSGAALLLPFQVKAIRRIVGVLVVAIGARHLQAGLG